MRLNFLLITSQRELSLSIRSQQVWGTPKLCKFGGTCADRGLTINQDISRTGLSISKPVGDVRKKRVNSRDRNFGDPEVFRYILSRKATNENRRRSFAQVCASMWWKMKFGNICLDKCSQLSDVSENSNVKTGLPEESADEG